MCNFCVNKVEHISGGNMLQIFMGPQYNFMSKSVCFLEIKIVTVPIWNLISVITFLVNKSRKDVRNVTFRDGVCFTYFRGLLDFWWSRNDGEISQTCAKKLFYYSFRGSLCLHKPINYPFSFLEPSIMVNNIQHLMFLAFLRSVNLDGTIWKICNV